MLSNRFLTFLSASLFASVTHAQVIEYQNDRETLRTFKPEATSAVVYTKDTLTIIVETSGAIQTESSETIAEAEEGTSTDSQEQTTASELPEAPAEKAEPEAAQQPTTRLQRIEYDVTIQQEQAQRVEGFFQNSPIVDDNALLLMYEQIEKRALKNEPIYEPMDFLFIGENGKVIQIIPSLIQANLNAPIVSEEAVKALLYLPAGHALNYNILPGNQVEHPLFDADPIIIK